MELEFQTPIEYFTHSIHNNHPVEGPLSLKVSRMGQLLVDAACQSAQEKRPIQV